MIYFAAREVLKVEYAVDEQYKGKKKSYLCIISLQ